MVRPSEGEFHAQLRAEGVEITTTVADDEESCDRCGSLRPCDCYVRYLT